MAGGSVSSGSAGQGPIPELPCRPAVSGCRAYGPSFPTLNGLADLAGGPARPGGRGSVPAPPDVRADRDGGSDLAGALEAPSPRATVRRFSGKMAPATSAERSCRPVRGRD